MSLRRPVVVLCVLGLVALGGYAWKANRPPGAAGGRAPAAQPSAGGAAAGGPVAVEAQPVRVLTLADDVTAVGSLVSNESVVLRPEVAGRISAIRFREGALVGKGEVLVELDAAVQRAELQQAQATLDLAHPSWPPSKNSLQRSKPCPPSPNKTT